MLHVPQGPAMFPNMYYFVLTNILFFVGAAFVVGATWNRWSTSQSRAVQGISESVKAKIIESGLSKKNHSALLTQFVTVTALGVCGAASL